MSDEAAFAEPQERTILIVDDDEVICEIMGHVVQREGFRVETAVDGDAALEKIRNRPPDLILLDLMLPRRGGYEILQELQKDSATAKIPIILVTGRVSDRATSDRMRLESNVVEYFTKPVNADVLAACLHRCLKTKAPGGAPAKGGR